MIHLSRLVLAYAVGSLFIAGSAFAAPPQHVIPFPAPPAAFDPPTVAAHSSQGYLGILPGDIDNQRAAALKLKNPAGAEIISVDRDGPAGKVGLRIHDVILQMNGQPIAGQAQLRRMLHETPAGRTITLLISRDGHQQSISVQLADRDTVEQQAWTQHMVIPAPEDDDTIVVDGPVSRGYSGGNGFFGALSLGSPSVGVELDTLGSQLADYFGVKDGQGLLVKHVAENSPASRAGLKAGDVITKANGQPIVTLSEWMKMLHVNRGKQVQITLVRNRREQTVTLDAATSKNRSELVLPSPGANADALNAEIAQLSTQLGDQFDPEILQMQMPDPSADWKLLEEQLREHQRESDQIKQLQQELDCLSRSQFQ